MLALPARVAELTPKQVLSETELERLTAWQASHRATAHLEHLVVNLGYCPEQAARIAPRLRFAAWLHRCGRLHEGVPGRVG